MDIIFIGTASCTPSMTRGVSCTALRLHSLPGSGTWLFDCGEGTQLQIQRTSSIRPSKITKIFITHAHGDHSFGLPGLLCLMGQDTAETKEPIDIYGPEGLRMWLRIAIRYSVSRIVPRYRVHELKEVTMAPEWGYTPMSHGVPCVGYVIEEPNRPGRLPLKEAGFKHPMKALAVIKDLPEGGSFTFPDGTVVTQQDAVEASRPGRKVVICGDTNSARSLEKLARDADVVVHEATNTFLHALDHKDSNLKSVTREAIFHGHSTPTMAGEFCKRVNAKRLILNHFSARYM
ncbi:Metallo-hydrolase/oxidoreductase, partial [Fragilariopsis cylindrus CCMP1102]